MALKTLHPEKIAHGEQVLNFSNISLLDLQGHLATSSSAASRLALNPGLNLTRVSFLLCSKVFSRIIFSVIFRASNHQLVDKKN